MPISIAPGISMSDMSNVGGLANYAADFVSSHPYGMSDDFMSSDAFKYSEYVNAKEREAADKQMRFQEEQNAKAMAFNASEAQKTRDWQERLANSAHQREIMDLMEAGLNPVLSIIGNNGSTTPSGATANAGSNLQGAKANVSSQAMEALITQMSKLYERQTQQELQNKQLETQMDIAKMQNELQEFLGILSADTSRYGASTSAWASKYVADMNYKIQEDFPNNRITRFIRITN